MNEGHERNGRPCMRDDDMSCTEYMMVVDGMWGVECMDAELHMSNGCNAWAHVQRGVGVHVCVHIRVYIRMVACVEPDVG